MSLFGTPWCQILLKSIPLIVSKEPTSSRAKSYLLLTQKELWPANQSKAPGLLWQTTLCHVLIQWPITVAQGLNQLFGLALSMFSTLSTKTEVHFLRTTWILTDKSWSSDAKRGRQDTGPQCWMNPMIGTSLLAETVPSVFRWIWESEGLTTIHSDILSSK